MSKIKSFNELKEFISADAYRYNPNVNHAVLKSYLIPGFRYTFWLRITAYLHTLSTQHRYTVILFLTSKLVLRHYKYKYGIEISYSTQIGKGLYIGHFGGIVISAKTIMGKNINLSHGITIGASNRGPREGVATLNNNIYIGPGAKIVGKVHIGYNVAVGANAVITRDIPANVSVAGVPAKIISSIGANNEYIQNPIK